MVKTAAQLAALAALLLAPAAAQDFHIYIGEITPTSVLVAWGSTAGNGNSIGRASRSYGTAEVQVGGRTARTDQNWAVVPGLDPDTEYPYEVTVAGRNIGGGRVRTWPERADRLAFFVIGDYGTGSSRQQRLGAVMWDQFEKRAASDNPVRFVLTTGDNIYADVNMFYIVSGSGDEDRHWDRKFFRPYKNLLGRIPFCPTLGNHDGNATENRGDLAVYLDNFFFPGNRPARWYTFSFGGLADFFALDSTENSLAGRPSPAYLKDGEQFAWMEQAFAESRAPWKIPYFHHPPFNAGPGHGASLVALQHWVDLFRKSGVRVVFSGHEHNFQFSRRDEATQNMLFVVSGAGGELRTANIEANMPRSHIAGWSPQRHFLDVEIEGTTMKITPLSYDEVMVRDPEGNPVPLPITVTAEKSDVLQ